MGLLRLLLALSVELYHGGAKVQMVGGWRAVQVFYLISGFYMALILDEKYNKTSYSTFLVNRALRLYPLYFLSLGFMGLRLFASYVRNVNCRYYFPLCGMIHWNHTLTIVFIAFTQLALIGQDWLFFLKLTPDGALRGTRNGLADTLRASDFNFNPVAWTLGLELSFYILAPLLLKRSIKFLAAAILGCFLMRAYLYFGLGLDFMPWTYRFFPTELGIFLSGSLLYRVYGSRWFADFWSKWTGLGHFLALIPILGTVLFARIERWLPFPTVPYYLFVALCIPFLFSVSRNLSLDRRLGELSFPIYLFHPGIAGIMRGLRLPNVYLQVGVTILASMLLVRFVVIPIDKLRQKRLERSKSHRNKFPPSIRSNLAGAPAKGPPAVQIKS